MVERLDLMILVVAKWEVVDLEAFGMIQGPRNIKRDVPIAKGTPT